MQGDTKEGRLILNKQQAIDTLKEDIRVGKETYEHMMANIDKVEDANVREQMETCLRNGELRNKEEQELIDRLEKDDNEYEIGFVKGERA